MPTPLLSLPPLRRRRRLWWWSACPRSASSWTSNPGFEMYGQISRTRMEPDGVAYINFRSNEAAQSAVDAARDSTFPPTLHSTPVQVMWASDPVPNGRGVGRKDGLSSKLVRPQMPLSRHGRCNKLRSTIVNPHDENNKNTNVDPNDDDRLSYAAGAIGTSGVEGPFRGREIVAYDDIL